MTSDAELDALVAKLRAVHDDDNLAIESADAIAALRRQRDEALAILPFDSAPIMRGRILQLEAQLAQAKKYVAVCKWIANDAAAIASAGKGKI